MLTEWIPVVAGALSRKDGRFLMHKRPLEKHHGGLWEFPGGKVEPGETPVNALIRELHEELGVEVTANNCRPSGFAEEPFEPGCQPIVIMLYTIGDWDGVPCALEGGEVDWFTSSEIEALDKPPLDIALAAQLFKKGDMNWC